MTKKPLLYAQEVSRIEAKIKGLEQLADVELRIILTRSSWMGIRNKARSLFKKYGLDKTAKANGVMLLLDVRNRELLIYGDTLVNKAVGQDFWLQMRANMLDLLGENLLCDALCCGLHQLGEKLAEHLPQNEKTNNALSNQIIFDL